LQVVILVEEHLHCPIAGIFAPLALNANVFQPQQAIFDGQELTLRMFFDICGPMRVFLNIGERKLIGTHMSENPVGQLWLVEKLGLDCMLPTTRSYCGQYARRTYVDDGITTERYGLSYKPDDTAIGHLKFALKNEPLDMAILAATFTVIDPSEIEGWVRDEPNGAYSRRVWFLYEWFTGKTLDVPNASNLSYVDALDTDLNVGSAPVSSQRHRVRDNMLGVPRFCLTVRRTDALTRFRDAEVDRKARELMSECDEELLERAVSYLFTKETKSSFEIEREEATGHKAERFVAALRNAAAFDPTKKADLIALQNVIVDERYRDRDFRTNQNFVGQTVGPGYEKVHFISPRPQDINSLMTDWAEMSVRLKGTPDAVVAAAAVAFAFVFLHPFEDGNGRIHRFLVHHILSREGFTPPDMLFPVSAAIIRDERGYEEALNTFSKPLLERINWRWVDNGRIEVTGKTDQLYRYFDATKVVEFLANKVQETVEHDLKDELVYVAVFDQAFRELSEIVDMPNRRASLLISLHLQNHGVLSKRKRELFPELTDQELASIGEAIRLAMEENSPHEKIAVDNGVASAPPPKPV
jgi:Fic family protein